MLTALHTPSSPTAITCVQFFTYDRAILHYKNYWQILNEHIYSYRIVQPVTSLICSSAVPDSVSELKMTGVGATVSDV